MKKISYSLVFNRKKKLNKKGMALVQVEAYLNRRKMYFSTRVYLKPDQWDVKRRMVKNHPNSDALNRMLYDFIADIEQKELGLWQQRRSISLDSLKDSIEKPENNGNSFLTFFKEEVNNSSLKESTRQNHLSTLELLQEYKKDIVFTDLTFEFVSSFDNYLQSKGYHLNTIAKHMKHLKRYVNLAINKDLFELQKYPFRKYKIKYMESKRGHLTPEELGRLENIAPKLQRTLRRTLDMFLFSCYTGLRFSDIVNIRPDNFHLIDDKLWLVYSSVKTDVNVRLPLFLLFDGKALAVYERYCKRYSRTLFGVSVSANSNVNKQLKRICRLAEIDKRLSFHMARHTNATLLLYNGANITTVQKLLGHKSVRTTEIYSDIMDMTVIRDLENITLK